MKSTLYIILILFLFSCKVKNKDKCLNKIDGVFKNGNEKVFGTEKINGKISEYRDFGEDSIKGGYYEFYQNGNLKSYHFFTDMETYIYELEYDSLGTLISTKGYPLVRKVVKVITNDSIDITLYFSSLNIMYNSIRIFIDNKIQPALTLVNDTLYTNMKIGKICFGNLKNEKDITFLFQIEYLNLCTQRVEKFKDSIILHYKP